MKKYNLLMLAGLLFAGASCKDYLEEDTTGLLYGANVLSTQDGLESALTGAYKGLAWQWNMGFIHPSANAATIGSDDVTTHPASNKADWREFDQFNVSTTNQRSGAVYNGCYKAIQGANNVINNYEKTSGDKATINIIVGEAYFIRAFSYYWLTRFYGNIPLILAGEYSADLLTVGKTAPDKIYELIVADLKVAEVNLPDTKRDPGRPNSGSAKAFLADVYLTMAGWPLKQTDKYDLAAAKAKEVIDNKEKYGFQLLPTFAAVFENDPNSTGTAEAVFQLNGFTGGGDTGNSTYGLTTMPGEEGGWDDMYAELNFFNAFPAGPRKDATFRTEFGLSGTKIPWQQSLTKHPYYKKWYIKGDISTYQASLPSVMLRYAHVLTIYAEAKARGKSGPDQAAYDALNQVRLRGWATGTKALSMSDGLSATQFADAVVQERAWEFACERTRWFDLVRLEKVEEANKNKSADDLQPIRAITKANYWFPLPYSDTSLNPNLNN
ncbi:RagB/SusD family nutrient uptake outer membrane protein [Dyadobacter subterraneus]|uniref:RagB/SusD family nutrient uptake outer membrane protein n=1 Tax=Dyadobacter subterraneus TaxID=2773304 RepID=A0ABR9WAH0_9BACT|nr:RagB/SusD family nutrient uptake outer membrane protein [Dyadobacter subterraneus]MBE9462479.1 RagB/SusD family nutrient uptake outer membrane protein [Dyadobacter subterraneus]